jgi:Siphovirus ReqiPepy6 Gp37-like protein
MATNYTLQVYRNSSRIDVVDNFATLSYTRRVNQPGYLTATFADDASIWDTLQLDDDVEVVRADFRRSVDMYNQVDFSGIFRGTSQSFDDQRGDQRTIHVPDLYYLLQKTIIAHKAGQDTLSTWANRRISQIISEIIWNNFTTTVSPTPAGVLARLIPVGTKILNPGIASQGSFINYSAAYKSVLEAINDLIQIDGLDLILERVTSWSNVGLRSLYGTDRSSTVYFWLERGNVLSPSFDKRREVEPTKALVGGQGEGTARATEVRTSTNYANPGNHYEMFVDARHLDNNAAMQSLGDSKLAAQAYKPNLTFRVMQIPSCIYGKHYFLGDKITAYYGGESVIQKIVGVTVNMDASGERIQAELENA